MTQTRSSIRGRAPRPGDSPFDGPLGSFLQVAVRFEDSLSRMLTPLARRVEQGPSRLARPSPPAPGRLEAA